MISLKVLHFTLSNEDRTGLMYFMYTRDARLADAENRGSSSSGSMYSGARLPSTSTNWALWVEEGTISEVDSRR